jgi:hypothetical protein
MVTANNVCNRCLVAKKTVGEMLAHCNKCEVMEYMVTDAQFDGTVNHVTLYVIDDIEKRVNDQYHELVDDLEGFGGLIDDMMSRRYRRLRMYKHLFELYKQKEV